MYVSINTPTHAHIHTHALQFIVIRFGFIVEMIMYVCNSVSLTRSLFSNYSWAHSLYLLRTIHAHIVLLILSYFDLTQVL